MPDTLPLDSRLQDDRVVVEALGSGREAARIVTGALRSEKPVANLTARVGQYEVPLDEFLVRIPKSTRLETVPAAPFTTAYSLTLSGALHNSHSVKYLGLGNDPFASFEVARLIDRWEQYTWSEAPGAREDYMSARRDVIAALLDNTPFQKKILRGLSLKDLLSPVLERDEFLSCPARETLSGIAKYAPRLERKAHEVPPGKLGLTRKARAHNAQRRSDLKEIKSEGEYLLARVHSELAALGHEYRVVYLAGRED